MTDWLNIRKSLERMKGLWEKRQPMSEWHWVSYQILKGWRKAMRHFQTFWKKNQPEALCLMKTLFKNEKENRNLSGVEKQRFFPQKEPSKDISHSNDWHLWINTVCSSFCEFSGLHEMFETNIVLLPVDKINEVHWDYDGKGFYLLPKRGKYFIHVFKLTN